MFGFLKRRSRAISAPEHHRLYAIGDVHGRLDLLIKTFAKIDADIATLPTGYQAIEIYLGDYVDRGPDSAGVIEALKQRIERGNIITLMGNHEAMMLAALGREADMPDWARSGGLTTLMSYDIPLAFPLDEQEVAAAHRALKRNMPDTHVAFLKDLRMAVSFGDYFFCHAGIRPYVPLEAQIRDDLLWIRDEFIESDRWHGKKIVHGHTPTEEPEVLPNRINIDTGAYITSNLTCLWLDGEQLGFLE